MSIEQSEPPSYFEPPYSGTQTSYESPAPSPSRIYEFPASGPETRPFLAGAIGGILAGAVAILLVFSISCFFYMKNRKNKRRREDSHTPRGEWGLASNLDICSFLVFTCHAISQSLVYFLLFIFSFLVNVWCFSSFVLSCCHLFWHVHQFQFTDFADSIKS